MRLAFTDNGIWAAEITASVVRHDFMWMLKKSTGTRAEIYIIVVLSCKVITIDCEYILEATAQSGNETVSKGEQIIHIINNQSSVCVLTSNAAEVGPPCGTVQHHQIDPTGEHLSIEGVSM